MADQVPWGDESDDEYFEEDNYETPDLSHQYGHPFVAAEHAITTVGDFVAYQDEIATWYIDGCGHDDPLSMWADFSRDLTMLDDPDEMDAAARDFAMDVSRIIVRKVSMAGLVEEDILETLGIGVVNEAVSLLAKAAAELTLDMFDDPTTDSGFRVPPSYRAASDVLLHKTPPVPPLCPLIPDSPIVALVLKPPDIGSLDVDCALRNDWVDTLSDVIGVPLEDVDTFIDNATAATGRSNTRPPGRGQVHFEFADGSSVNIGSHGYILSVDVRCPLVTGGEEHALSEMFAAPGGEGLTCATPSHTLHQMVSACLSNAFAQVEVVVEEENVDIAVACQVGTESRLCIDVTSSAGIWNKRLLPDKNNPTFRRQAAISKYDVAAVFIAYCHGPVAQAFAKAVANCLACEFPGIWRAHVDDVPHDLQLQSSIHKELSCLSQRQIGKLGELCYEAAMRETHMEMSQVNLSSQGIPFKEKRDILIAAVDRLKPRSGVACPPLPLGDIKGFDSEQLNIEIHGHDFCAGPVTMQGRRAGPRHHMEDQNAFLMAYPVTGIVSHGESKDLADYLDETPAQVEGKSHEGPGYTYEGKDSEIARFADQIYSRSSSAQLAEIRADLARAVYRLPMPPRATWQQVYLYKGKVCCWYSCRDNPVSPDGFRIDWFCVTAFPVLTSTPWATSAGEIVHLWPRQRMRSQELSLAHMGPRRLKAMLFSMLDKCLASRTNADDVRLAWEKFAHTLVTSTWASGVNFITPRYLSATMSSPASPFHEMGKKLVEPKTFADVLYLSRLSKVLKSWVTRDQYRDKAPLLGLPRSYSQAESYWMLWVPSEFADGDKNMAQCIMALSSEAKFLKDTEELRVADLSSQLMLLQENKLTLKDLQLSLRASCDLPTDRKLGWTWIGSLASGHALHLKGDAGVFDRKFGRGTKHRTMVDHLTVRHSARMDEHGNIKKGTVAELMLDAGTDQFLSTLDQTFRFLYGDVPKFFNHPKNREHKNREISITDPDSRIVLSDAEHICGAYGRTTGIDFLKDPGKDSKFYNTSSRILRRGGGIQSSDASRYGPMMSNFAIAVMLILLGSYSMHLRWCSVVYGRLAFRQMLLPVSVLPSLDQMAGHDDTHDAAAQTSDWMRSMPVVGRDATCDYVGYTTSHHMGQGMSHHSSSLLHAGGLVIAHDAACQCEITVNGTRMRITPHLMVTSDDSTSLPEPTPAVDGEVATRAERQAAARIFLSLIRAGRKVSLRMVSVMPNLVKEVISATKGEFNSNDTGIGATCPILGFRELVSQIVAPSSASLVGDFLTGHASAREIAFAGQGLVTGSYVHHLLIDAIEERWGLSTVHKETMASIEILPAPLITGCSGYDLVSSPSSWMAVDTRASLFQMAVDKNAEDEDLDPHVRDTIFSPMMHVKIGMSGQHKRAISVIRKKAAKLATLGMAHQAEMLEGSLRSTLSSARSRNLGRVAHRIASRKVCPPKYGECEFTRDGMLETTLNWLLYLDGRVGSDTPSAGSVRNANQLAGYVKLVGKQRFGFPIPPKLRKFHPPRNKKPLFRSNGYGNTPFGRHALKRSGTVTVASMGKAERVAIQEHLAASRHRRFSQHIEYGGSFVTSWHKLECGQIIPIDISGDIALQQTERIKKGSYAGHAVERLKQLQREHPDTPVLSLHSYDGSKGLWHCIHRGVAYTVITAFDDDQYYGSAMHWTYSPGVNVLLAVQGYADTDVWKSTVPSAIEVSEYQDAPADMEMPGIVSSIQSENIQFGRLNNATYATELDVDGETILVYVQPDAWTKPLTHPLAAGRVPYLRGGVVAESSMTGYWHSSMRGTCLRAFLKGHYEGETIWTGGVIGWRGSSTTTPEYYASNSGTVSVNAIIVLDGTNDPDELSLLNPGLLSEGCKVVSKSNTRTYRRVVRIAAKHKDLIVRLNNGARFDTGEGKPTFLDMRQGPAPPELPITREDALDSILRVMRGEEPEDDPW